MSSEGNMDIVQTDDAEGKDAQMDDLIEQFKTCTLKRKQEAMLRPFRMKQKEDDDAQTLAKHLLPVLCQEQKKLGKRALRMLLENSSTIAELLNAKELPYEYKKAARNVEFLRSCEPIFREFLLNEMFMAEKQHAAKEKALVAEIEELKKLIGVERRPQTEKLASLQHENAFMPPTPGRYHNAVAARHEMVQSTPARDCEIAFDNSVRNLQVSSLYALADIHLERNAQICHGIEYGKSLTPGRSNLKCIELLSPDLPDLK